MSQNLSAPSFAPSGDDRRSLEVLNEVARIATLDLELHPMLQRITDTLAVKFGWEFVALASIDLVRQVFVCEALSTTVETSVYLGYSRSLGSGVVGTVAATRQPVLIDDTRDWPGYVQTTPGVLSEICVPVEHHGRIVALLNLESKRLGAFHDQLTLLKTVADQIAGAIASAQLFEELRQRARLMEMMSEVTRTAMEAIDRRDLLDRIAHYIQDRFPLAVAGIFMVDREQEEFVLEATGRPEAGSLFQRWPLSQGIVGRCIRTGTTQYVEDVSLDPEYLPVYAHVTSELVVPIRFQNDVLGALNLESMTSEVFTPANVLAFEAFADQVAGAIRMASVNQKLAETTRELEANARALEDANSLLAGMVDKLQLISAMDGLTGVANRRHFDETLALEWRRAARNSTPMSLLMLDIDYFKAFNDTAGHQAGDDCLRRVAHKLRDAVQRVGDLVARYGGEEFAVLLPGTDATKAMQFADKLREDIAALRIAHAASPFTFVTVSIGVATVAPPRDASGMEDLIGIADSALYEAKHRGRNGVVRGLEP